MSSSTPFSILPSHPRSPCPHLPYRPHSLCVIVFRLNGYGRLGEKNCMPKRWKVKYQLGVIALSVTGSSGLQEAGLTTCCIFQLHHTVQAEIYISVVNLLRRFTRFPCSLSLTLQIISVPEDKCIRMFASSPKPRIFPRPQACRLWERARWELGVLSESAISPKVNSKVVGGM